ncbi:bifunctional DNA primase/polymerase [Streptomyces sp. 6N223]|uniref:bifunctional DNA primase/polymerase n=1 Tax=Streptomyces sp. 6N223 TaxID=3457412 RepID=UPI003FCF0FD3
MREILGELGNGKRRGPDDGEGGGGSGTGSGSGDSDGGEFAAGTRRAALAYAREFGWPVVPGAQARPEETGAVCGCPRGRDCPAPGAHPFDPQLLAATTDARMVGWWWATRPGAPIMLATGGRAPCALTLPVPAGVWAVEELDRQGVRTGPVAAGASRLALLVRPYELPELGELLGTRYGAVPGALRFHGPGGHLTLPPSLAAGAGGPAGADRPDRPDRAGKAGRAARWLRPPERRAGRVALPRAAWLLDVLIEAGFSLGVLSEQQ